MQKNVKLHGGPTEAENCRNILWIDFKIMSKWQNPPDPLLSGEKRHGRVVSAHPRRDTIFRIIKTTANATRNEQNKKESIGTAIGETHAFPVPSAAALFVYYFAKITRIAANDGSSTQGYKCFVITVIQDAPCHAKKRRKQTINRCFHFTPSPRHT